MIKKILFATACVLFVASGPVMAQDGDVPPAPFDMSGLEVYSIFIENFKNKDYENSLMWGRWLLAAHPKSMTDLPQYNGKRVHEQMIKAFEEISKKQNDPTLRSTYIDSSLYLYDRVSKLWEDGELDRYDWAFNKGRFIQKNADYITDGLDKAYEIYGRLFDEDPEKTTKRGKGYYVQILLQKMAKDGDRDEIFAFIDKSEPFANDETKAYYEKVRESFLDNPEERIAFLEEKRSADPNNLELITELFDLYDQEEITDSTASLGQRLYELDPNYENTIRLATNARKNANYSEATALSLEALDKTEDSELRKVIYLDLASDVLNQEKLQDARKYARLALKEDGNYGRAFEKISEVYQTAITTCGTMERQDKAVYWLVMDYLERAKRADPSSSSRINERIRSLKPVLPTAEDKFFVGWKVDDKLSVDASLKACYGWVKETTKVR